MHLPDINVWLALAFASHKQEYWRDYTRRRTFSPKVWNDAFLAAFAKAAAFEIVTFDKGFSQFKGVRCDIPSDHDD